MKFSAARSELDSMVVEIELTLVSIIQGVALTILIENAHAVIAERQLFSGSTWSPGCSSFLFSGHARCCTSSP